MVARQMGTVPGGGHPLLDQAAQLHGAHPLGGDREDRAREARLRLSHFERLERLAALVELLGELMEAELVTGCGWVAPERNTK
jgi:hypothetical protein